MKQLDRLLLFQGNRCFFCDQPIPDGEASVEHLIASANGGGNEDDNCVACCKTLNAALGHHSYKEKLRAILSHRGRFTCPRPTPPPSTATVTPPPAAPQPSKNSQVAIILADLRKRGAARPRKLASLHNTIDSIFKKQLTEAEIDALIARLIAGKHITVVDETVSYKLPAKQEEAHLPPAKAGIAL